MEKIWLKSYAPHVSAEIPAIAADDSIVKLFSESCQRFAEQTAYSNLGTQLKFKDVQRFSLQFAAFLQQKLGLQKGQRLAIMLPNVFQYPIVMFGALQAGLIVVNVNPLYT